MSLFHQLFVLALLFMQQTYAAETTCKSLADCIKQHNCIDVVKAGLDIWGDLVKDASHLRIDRVYAQIDFDCAMLKCSSQCVKCHECALVKDALVQGISMEFDLYSKLLMEDKYYKNDVPRAYHRCPQMQKCVHGCVPDVTAFQANLKFLPKCLVESRNMPGGHNCAMNGYNGDCPEFFGLTRKMFVHMCYQNNMHVLTKNPSCEELWKKANYYKHRDLGVKYHLDYPMNVTVRS